MTWKRERPWWRRRSRTTTVEPTPAPTPEPTTPTQEPAPVAGASVNNGYGQWDENNRPPATWRPYADSSVWNRGVPATPTLHANSSAWIADLLSLGGKTISDSVISPGDYYHPIYYADSDDPLLAVQQSEPNWTPDPWKIPVGSSVRLPAEARWAAGTDGHLAVINWADGYEYSFFRVSDISGGTIYCKSAGRTSIRGDGLGPNVTAGCNGLAAGAVRFQEVNEINHALFVVVASGGTNGQWVYPATGAAGGTRPNGIPDGAWLWLDMTDAEIDALEVNAPKTAMLKALARYGGFVMDTGGSACLGFQTESPLGYTVFGQPDPWRQWAHDNPGRDVYVGDSGAYLLWDDSDSIPWSTRLHVLEVPAA